MKFKCNACGGVVIRDMRQNFNKQFITKRGLKSYCGKAGRNVFMKKVEKDLTQLMNNALSI